MPRAQQTRPPTGPMTLASSVTVVVADDRPLVRAGLQAVLADDERVEIAATCRLDEVLSWVKSAGPTLLAVVLREHDPDPFRIIAAAKAVQDDLRVLAIADTASVVDLREAVIAGVDSFLLTTASEADVREAVSATARGERIVSPEVALELAGSWRAERHDGRTSALTPRELEVLHLLAEGCTNQEIGRRLGLSARTIKTHVQNLLTKLDVPDRTGAVARGFRLGLIR